MTEKPKTIRKLCSGIAICPSSQTVTTEGANQVAAGTAQDNAGNSATTSVTVSIDKTPPSLQVIRSPQANADGWNGQSVIVSFLASDSLSGVAR